MGVVSVRRPGGGQIAAGRPQLDRVRHLVDGDAMFTLNLAKLLTKSGGTVGTIRGIARHRLFDHRGHVGRQAFPTQIRDRLRGDPQKLGHHLFTAAALEGGMTGDGGKQCRTK
ncbi:hypothetical protein YM3MPS_25820 [Mycobacterium pseudoshottsii]|uniref:Uncharacterized protein n=1 Tax=Mycobacterium pseudoshottsii TaxID=265949 RepID=A0A9N7QMY5_9MYCO|nr:hypothetical protein NJB1907Z4_C26000 [Mycobacterium pseudoshottsii]BEH76779.1 hypothetical protein YM3MPS_25820 [Mycobacterium pseudoshottsii]